MSWRDTVREIYDAAESPDPHVIAADAAKAMSAEELTEAAAALLPDAVREMIRSDRMKHRSPAGSSRWADASDYLSDPMRAQVHVPVVGWKFRGDLTASDCDAVAQFYDGQAAAMAAEADKFRTLARELRDAGVECVRDLDGLMEVAA